MTHIYYLVVSGLISVIHRVTNIYYGVILMILCCVAWHEEYV